MTKKGTGDRVPFIAMIFFSIKLKIYFLMKMNKGTILIIQLCHFFTVKFPDPTSGSPEGV